MHKSIFVFYIYVDMENRLVVFAVLFQRCNSVLEIKLLRPISKHIHRHVFRPSQDSSVWLGLMSRE